MLAQMFFLSPSLGSRENYGGSHSPQNLIGGKISTKIKRCRDPKFKYSLF